MMVKRNAIEDLVFLRLIFNELNGFNAVVSENCL